MSQEVSPATLSYFVKGETVFEIGESGVMNAGPKFPSPTLDTPIVASHDAQNLTPTLEISVAVS